VLEKNMESEEEKANIETVDEARRKKKEALASAAPS
jgi:hypothetical protein